MVNVTGHVYFGESTQTQAPTDTRGTYMSGWQQLWVLLTIFVRWRPVVFPLWLFPNPLQTVWKQVQSRVTEQKIQNEIRLNRPSGKGHGRNIKQKNRHLWPITHGFLSYSLSPRMPWFFFFYLNGRMCRFPCHTMTWRFKSALVIYQQSKTDWGHLCLPLYCWEILCTCVK